MIKPEHIVIVERRLRKDFLDRMDSCKELLGDYFDEVFDGGKMQAMDARIKDRAVNCLFAAEQSVLVGEALKIAGIANTAI